MIEKEESNPVKEHNIRTLLTLRALLIDIPPILTVDLKIGNLRRDDKNDFVYRDLD